MRFSKAAATALFLTGASAHMFMKTPEPFNSGPNGVLLASSPLGLDKDNKTKIYAFPCQFGPDFKYPMDNAIQVTAGSSTLLSFHGSAIHGSGSCQVSLSKSASSDPKQWKVIHSIIGGCPGTSAPYTGAGHAPAGGEDNLVDLNGPLETTDTSLLPMGLQCNTTDTDDIGCLKSYNVPIPKDVASGQYFFAWTWFNKLGNREMYMNCAPIQVTGCSDSEDWLNNQPSIFFANYEGQPCNTTEGFSVDFPQPGDSVLRSQNPFDSVSPKGLSACAALYPPQKSAPAHIASLLPRTASNSTISNISIIATPSVASPTSSPAPGVSSGSATPETSAPTSAASSVSAAPQYSATPGSPAAGCANPCPEDGKLICLPSNTFGICDHGCAVPQALAAGTMCQNGAIIGLTGKRGIPKLRRVSKPRRALLRKIFA